MSTGTGIIGYLLDSLGTDNEVQDIIDTKITGPTGTGFGAIQTGPDGQIYLAINNNQTVGSLTLGGDRDQIALNASAININPDNAGRLSRLGLPNFVLNAGVPTQIPGLLVEDACLGQGTPLVASGSSNIDQYEWEVFDPPGIDRAGGPAASDSINITYDTTGVFDISVRIFNRCATTRQGTGPQQGETLNPLPSPFSIDTTLFDEVEVNPIPELPMVPDDTSLCNGPILLVAFSDSTRTDLSYNWSTGDTTRTITVTEPAVIDISITNLEGCSSDTLQTFIADGRPQIDLGPDQAVCQFDNFPDLDAQNTQVFYQWTIDSLEANETRFQPVNTDSVGVFTYAIQVIEPRNECAGSDTIQITIRETPDVITDFTPPSDCGVSDASVAFDINSQGSFLYSFINPDTSLVDNIDGPASGPTIGDLGIGTYNLSVENLVTGCTFRESLFVENDVPFDLTASNLPDCNTDVSLQLTLTGTQLPESANVYVTTATNDTLFTQLNRRPPFLFSPNLENGEYFVTVTDALTGCAQVDSVLVQPFIPGPGDCLPAILAPNAFSPNGNSANEEFFIIPNPYIGDFEIYIYTRWGELVYFSENINFRWDGTYENKVLPVGTYAYVIRFTSIEDPSIGEQIQYGSVTLVR
jgi:gliding motility-associated-like protein